MLTRYWSDSGRNRDEKTFPSPQPRLQIDHIFYRPAVSVRIVDYEIVDDSLASDHRPIVVNMETHRE